MISIVLLPTRLFNNLMVIPIKLLQASERGSALNGIMDHISRIQPFFRFNVVTTDGNTLINGFVAYCANRMAGMDPD